MTVVVTFQKFAKWKNDTAIYSKSSDDDFPEQLVQVISNPVLDENKEIDLDLISAFSRCPNDCAIFVYETEIPAHEIIENKECFYGCREEYNLVYGTDTDIDFSEYCPELAA